MSSKSGFRPVFRSSKEWCRYFRTNLGRLLELPWDRGAELTPDEIEALGPSLQEFQLGETSEGKNLKEAAARYAAAAGDENYPEAIALFIKEEQRHARLLGEFLLLAGIPLATHSKLDGLFRRMRRMAGLELAITILVVAETIGKVYYQAMRLASASSLLRRVCDQLLRDEVMHLRFHCERLALLRVQRSAWRIKLRQLGHGIVFRVAALAVWWKHGRAFRAAGMGFLAYWQSCRHAQLAVLRCSHPKYFDCRHLPATEASGILSPLGSVQ